MARSIDGEVLLDHPDRCGIELSSPASQHLFQIGHCGGVALGGTVAGR